MSIGGEPQINNIKSDTEQKEKINFSIIIAEDDEDLRRVFKAFLDHFYTTVEVATDGKELVEMVVNSGKNYNLIISDLSMPEMDGLSAIKKIREEKRFEKIHFILHSGSLDDDTKKEAESLENGYCFEKNVDPYIYIQTIEKIISDQEKEKIKQKKII